MSIESDLAIAVEKAMVELQSTTLKTIQRQTAVTWCGRALAAYHIYEVATLAGVNGSLQALLDAIEYEHEALEHAALAGPDMYNAVLYQLEQVKRSLGIQ